MSDDRASWRPPCGILLPGGASCATFSIPRRSATDATNTTVVVNVLLSELTEDRFDVSRALQSLPAVMTPENLWAAGFRSHALCPTAFRP